MMWQGAAVVAVVAGEAIVVAEGANDVAGREVLLLPLWR
jgi:hypothetical protein